jgi:hypothetical protein
VCGLLARKFKIFQGIIVLILIISAAKVTFRFTLRQTVRLGLGPTWGLWTDFGLYGTCLGVPSLTDWGL